MPTIEQDLQQIRKAVYGREVREAIADGIEHCYDDVTNGVTLAEAAVTDVNDAIAAAETQTAAAIANVNTAITRANTAAEQSEEINEELGYNANSLVLVQANQPTEIFNKLWVKPESDEYEVPTYAEHQAVAADVSSLKSAVEAFEAEISTTDTITNTDTIYYETPWHTGGGINANGTLVEVGTWAYTDKIPVQKGDVITCDALNGSLQRTSRPIRYLCAYNGDTPVPASGTSSEIQTYTVGDGVTHIVVTQASYTSYTGQRVINTRVASTNIIWPKQNSIGGFRQQGNLSSGDEFIFPITNINQYKVFSFSGKVSAFSSLTLGRYVDNATKESVTIGTTKVTVTNSYGTTYDFDYPTEQLQPTDPPVFTVQENIQVLITTGKRNRLTLIQVISNGVVFEVRESQLENITWNANKGYPYVKSVESTLTNCFASWTTRKIDTPIWLFGDSYLSYDKKRWAYYLIEAGYDKDCLINAYAGENSANAKIAFDSIISVARPKYVIWALGMNDGDAVSDDAPNGNWKNVVEGVIDKCENMGIIPILCTIPTTPLVNNNYKNAWIKNESGCRYIDFAAGVGADASGDWYDGLLSSDNVHPTEEGAKTLYYHFLSEFPEIVIDD